MSDEELREWIALQERYRDTGEPADQIAAADKLRYLYAEMEARTRRNRLRIVAPDDP